MDHQHRPEHSQSDSQRLSLTATSSVSEAPATDSITVQSLSAYRPSHQAAVAQRAALPQTTQTFVQQGVRMSAIQQQQPGSGIRRDGFKVGYESLGENGEVEADCSSSWGLSMPAMPSLPSLNAQFLRDSTSSISDYLPSVGLPSISQHMPRMSIPSMPSMPSMPSFTMPNLPNLPHLPNLPNLPSLPNFISYRQHKSWSDLREAVRVAHRRLSEISNRVPFAFHFRPIQIESGDAAIGSIPGVRLYFLCPAANTPETTLHYCDVFDICSEAADSATSKDQDDANGAENGHSLPSSRCRVFDWKPLISPNFRKSKDADKEMNLEEKLLMERKRCMLSGITSYEFHQQSRRFVFASGSSLFYFDDDQDLNDGSSPSPPYTPVKIDSLVNAAKMSPQICPHNPDLIAFVSEGNLFVTSVASGQEVQLTDVPDSCVTAGLPPYVIQEEFRRYCGFWWQPPPSPKSDPSAAPAHTDYSILFEEVDESHVNIVRIPSYDGTSEEYRYPRAGDQNATSCLKLVSFKYDPVTNSVVNADSVFPSVGLTDLRSVSPDLEYLVRAGWYDNDAYWVQTLNRKQNQLDLSFFSVSSAFPPQIILQEISADLWVNVGDLLHFIGPKDVALKPGSSIRFIWTSEATGFRHLYSVSAVIAGEEPLLAHAEDQMDCISVAAASVKRANNVRRQAITCGNWEVADREVWVNDEAHLIYFIALKEIPLERHVYVTSLDSDASSQRSVNPMKRLTESGFSHTYAAFDPCHQYFVNIQSNVSVPPFGFIHRLAQPDHSDGRSPVSGSSSPKRRIMDNDSCPLPSFKKLGLVASNPFISTIDSPLITSNASLSLINDQIDLMPGLPKPELFTYQLKSGDLVYGVIFKPEFMENGVKYPCILDIYGGPEVQVVTNSFKGIRLVRRHLLASEGYVVAAFDCRGSHCRGKKFEGHLFKSMGQVEIADQVEVLTWLSENTGYIDMKRVAVHGWSYGGYLSLMALAQRPDIFKLAIAGAPVTKWTLYDTGYTERYMDTPFNNAEGYEKGSVLNYVSSFPEEENRLLVIHGLMDENVHFVHSAELINALIKAGKPYQLQVYPSERHSLRNGPCCEHYESYLLSYLQQHL